MVNMENLDAKVLPFEIELIYNMQLPKKVKTGMLTADLTSEPLKLAIIHFSMGHVGTLITHLPREATLIDLSNELVIFQYKTDIISSWAFADFTGNKTQEFIVADCLQHSLSIFETTHGNLIKTLTFDSRESIPSDILPLSIPSANKTREETYLLIAGNNHPLYLYHRNTSTPNVVLKPPRPLSNFGLVNALSIYPSGDNNNLRYLVITGTQPQKILKFLKKDKAFAWIYQLKDIDISSGLHADSFSFLAQMPLKLNPRQIAINQAISQMAVMGDLTFVYGYDLKNYRQAWKYKLYLWPNRLISIPYIHDYHPLNHTYLIIAGQFLICLDQFGKRIFKHQFRKLSDILYVPPNDNVWKQHLLLTMGTRSIEIYSLS